MWTTNVQLSIHILVILCMSTQRLLEQTHAESNSLYSCENLTFTLANVQPNDICTEKYHQAVLFINLHKHLSSIVKKSHHLHYLSVLLILQSADCELNPGPRTPKYPCMVCGKAVRWNQRAVACDNCEGWYHVDCMNMNSHVYSALTKSNTSWVCCSCGIPNFSTSLFESFDIDTSNHYESLSEQTTSSFCSDIDIGEPIGTSSPKASTRKNQHPQTSRVGGASIKTLTINFQSVKSKRESFWNLVDSSKPDIIFGCETWLRPNITTQEVMPPGYNTYRKDRADGYGGVLVAVKDTLISSQVDIAFNSELVAVQIEGEGTKPLIVGSFYRQPNRNIDHTNNMCEDIRKLTSKFSTSTIWLAGDANLPDINWEQDTIDGNSYPRDICESFLRLKIDCGFSQTINFPTRENRTLELFFTNRPSLVNRCTPIPGISDHDTIAYIESNIKARYPKPVKRKIYLWKRANMDHLKESMLSFVKDYMEEYGIETDINILWEKFETRCTELMEENIPSKMTSTRYSQPWINSEVKRLSQRKKRYYRRAKKSGKQRDWRNFNDIKKEAQRVCQETYNNYISGMLEEDNSSNPKKFWSFIKSKRADSSGVAPLRRDGTLFSDSNTKANILNDQFTSVFSRETTDEIPSKGDSPYPTVPDINITAPGVLKLLNNINPNKATGPDSIPGKLLKDLAQEISPALTLIFNASLHQGKIPSQWSKATVVPLFKKGDKGKAPTIDQCP